ncbi:MAG TPA: PaaI family thioesterase [Candidatus Limnocylindria bacterium]|nr:PaaI family thioesterase [Candidatus Limnocylindria bacterium]
MLRVDESLQDRYAPNGICFGCGPRNERGLRIKSHVRGDDVVTRWRPEKLHEAYEGVLSGGAIGTLMDCHSLWTAAYHLMKRDGAASPPPMVTAEYTIKMRRPTPTDGELEIVARLVGISEDRATVAAELHAGGKVCATSSGVFVAVKPGHPAYHRW